MSVYMVQLYVSNHIITYTPSYAPEISYSLGHAQCWLSCSAHAQFPITVWPRRRNVENKTAFLFSVDKKNQLDVTFIFFISLLMVAQHISGNHVPIIRS